MAENYIFRSAVNGFNRSDVIAYIDSILREKAEAELRIAVLENEVNELNSANNSLREIIVDENKKDEETCKCDNCDIAKVYEARLGAAMLDAKRFSEILVKEANDKAAGMFSKAYESAEDTSVKAKDISENIVNINRQFNESFKALLDNMKKLGESLELFKSEVKNTGSVFDYSTEFAPVDSIVLHSDLKRINKGSNELNFDDVADFEIKVDV